MSEVVQVQTKRLQPHPRHSHYHSDFLANMTRYMYIRADVEKNGIMTPLQVRAETGEILDGHMRLSLAQDFGYETVPVIFLECNEEEAEYWLVESNRTRRNQEQDPIRVAHQIRLLKDKYGVRPGEHPDQEQQTVDELAQLIGIHRRQFYSYLRLNYLIEPFRTMVSGMRIGIRAGVALSRLSREQQTRVFEQLRGLEDEIKSDVVEALIESMSPVEQDVVPSAPHHSKQAELDAAISEIDAEFPDLPAVPPNLRLRQTVETASQLLSVKGSEQFVQAITKVKIEKHLRKIARAESDIVGLLTTEMTDMEMLDVCEQMLDRIKRKVDEARVRIK